MRLALPLLLSALAFATAAQAQHPPGLGFAFRPQPDGLHVTAIAPDGAAARAELRVGDIVTSVGGLSMVGADRDAIASWLRTVNAGGETVRLDIRRGGTAFSMGLFPIPYDRDALAAQGAPSELSLDDIAPDGSFLDMLSEIAETIDPRVAALSEALGRSAHPRTAAREGGHLVLASETCTTRIAVGDATRAEAAREIRDAQRHIEITGGDATSACRRADGTTSETRPARLLLDLATEADRDAALAALRAVLLWWDWPDHGPSARELPGGSGCVDGDCQDGLGATRYASGGAYAGQWEGGRRHGRGTYSWSNGMTFTGRWEAGSRVHGRETFTSGNVYEGGYAGDKRHGEGTMTYASGNRYEGAWRDGKRHGEGTFTWPSGATFTGEWAADARVRGVNRYSDGRVYDGAYADDKRHGPGTLTHPDGRVEAGTWEADVLVAAATPVVAPAPTPAAAADACVSGDCTDGTGTRRYADGQTYTGTFRDGLPVRGRLTMSSGDTYEGEFDADGKFHGEGFYTFGAGDYAGHTFRGTFATGTPTSGTYTWASGQTYTGDWDGWSRTGTGTMAYTNGNRYEGAWLDGDRHGEGTFTWPNGTVFAGTWVGDARTNGREAFPSGNVYVGAYAGDKRHGEGTMTYASGQAYTGTWEAGQRAGTGVYTWPTGQRYEGAYKAGQRHGQGTQRYADGRVFVGAWEEGKPVEGTLQHAGGEPRPVRVENDRFVYLD